MKGRNEIFLSKSVSFAIEMVRACLRHAPTDVRLEGLWMQMNMGTGIIGSEDCGQREIVLSILIYPDIGVNAACTVTCTDGKWTSGRVALDLLNHNRYDLNTRRWQFDCRLGSDGQIGVTRINDLVRTDQATPCENRKVRVPEPHQGETSPGEKTSRIPYDETLDRVIAVTLAAPPKRR